MGKLKLYYIVLSPANRAVLLTIKALNLDVELIPINSLAAEHLKPEFIALNPQHQLPTLVHDDFIIWDSHAICTYLATKYGSPSSVLSQPPTDAEQRARFDQRLHYHHGTLFQRYYGAFGRVFSHNAVEYCNDEQVAAIHEALGFLETFLETEAEGYVLGNRLSVADILCVTTVSTLVTGLLIDVSRYARIGQWLKRLAVELPGYEEIDVQGVLKYRAKLLERVQENELSAQAKEK